MTNHWKDIKNTDVVLVMGANPAENHPCGFKWAVEARERRGATIVTIDPRFTRTSAVADKHLQIRPGSDIAILGGFIHYMLENDLYHADYVRLHTNASFVVREDFGFDDGLFTGYDEAAGGYDKTTWDYERGKDGYVVRDATLQHPRCVFQLLKRHYSRYTPEMVAKNFESLERKPIVGSHENDRRHGGPQFYAYLQPVQAGHLHVQKNQLRALGTDGLQRLSPIGGLPDDLEIPRPLEQMSEPTARRRLVIHHQGPNRHGLRHHRSSHWRREDTPPPRTDKTTEAPDRCACETGG